MIICFVEKINTFSKINKKNFKITKHTLQELMPTEEDIHCACPTCGAKNNFSYHSSYERNFSFLDNGVLCDVLLSVTRVICNSCSHTHACLPDYIVPYKIISRDSILSIVSQSTKTSVLEVAEKLQISFELIYSFISILMSFFPKVDILNKEKNFVKNLNQEYFKLNCIEFCSDQFMVQYFKHYQWIFLMTKFQNTVSPPIRIGLNCTVSHNF